MQMKAEKIDLETVMNGWLEDDAHIYPLMVQYEDTDAAGIVYHANYINFAERARTALLRCMGEVNAEYAAGHWRCGRLDTGGA